MKKFLAFVLACMFVVSMGALAFADGSETPYDPGTNVPVVTPNVTQPISEEVQESVPEIADSPEEAVEMLSEDTPVVVAEGEVSCVRNGEIVTFIGFNVVDAETNDTVEIVKNAEVVDAIRREDLIMTPLAEKSTLSEEKATQFADDVNALVEAESAQGGTLLSAWWFNADEESAGEVAVMINEHKTDVTDEMNYGVKFTFACLGTEPRVYLNEVLLPIVENADGTYTVILSEEGSVAIFGNLNTVITSTVVEVNKAG